MLDDRTANKCIHQMCGPAPPWRERGCGRHGPCKARAALAHPLVMQSFGGARSGRVFGGNVPRTDEQVIDRLICRRDPADAVAAYYAWWHAGTRFHVERSGMDVGVFLEASSEHGPVGVLRATAPSVVPALLGAISVGRRYFMAPWALADSVQMAVQVEEVERNRVFWLDHQRFSPATAATASLRVEGTAVVAIVEDEVAAKCWLLWQSPAFAELAVGTEPRFQRQGLARAVLSAMISKLLERKVTPLHIATVTNTASIRLAKGLGFTRCAADEFAGYVVKEHPDASCTSGACRDSGSWSGDAKTAEQGAAAEADKPRR